MRRKHQADKIEIRLTLEEISILAEALARPLLCPTPRRERKRKQLREDMMVTLAQAREEED